MTKRLIPVMLSLLLASLTVPAQAQGDVNAPAQTRAPHGAATLLRIDAMSTPTCPVLVKAAVRRLDGILNVEASLEQRTATVAFDAGKTSLDEIQRVIKQQVGFDSEVIH